MPSLPGIRHQDAVRAFQRAGYRVERQGDHIIMKGRLRTLVIPRHNPINAYTMGAIVRTAGLTIEEFKALL